MSTQTFVIVGASLAGAKAAETLREEGFDGRVVLLGEETERPYERPELSKGFLLGKKPADKLYVHPADFYAGHDIELRTSTTVTALDPGAHEVVLDGGERLGYDRLLLATGASSRRFPVAGADLPGVAYLRQMGESDDLRTAIQGASRVVVVGAGWIGSEVAACARMLGAEVSMIAPEAVPLERVLGPEVGAVYRDLHADKGVDLHLSTGVDRIEGTDAATGVRTSDGTLVEGDLVVVGIGAAPRDELARAAGLEVDNGVLTDEHLRTSDPDIYAAGDVANAMHPFYGKRIRVEHWANALNQGPAAARNMLGAGTAYSRVPYFYSDQYDFGMEYNGYATEWDRVVFRGDPASREFLAFWVRDGQVLAGLNANIWDQADGIKALVRSGARVDTDRLADPSVDLGDLLG
ncbi:NAD(P)/FAD-dependent oxidoreductase [Oryzihumus leptocrescens]|uniref:3-phenylpropionate/trans-cinnamate dioxygenase ferredoxin reductase subunit n=1 Tax=Oryzihumus leptocrescens TaxID=297536 RepID=A0A542ZEC9_9MICO|nr:FAD-dependent oxidoreductase [Oryzihumus leptocrescens]TQL58705.1 3-phenylpropionate/trans-cinnamate dioxygenase ferredoxin reductase subunit [Oryzihumus leptocrescens]